MRPRLPWPVWLETHTSRLSNLPKESTGRSFWPTSTRDQWDIRKIAAGRAPDRFPTLENASSPTELNNTLLQHFFPPRPSPPPPLVLPAFKDVPPVLPGEVSSALRKSSNTSAPGPSGIPYSIWKQVHKANEQLLLSLFTPLLTHGYHSLAMKKANGIVLDKPGKPDYRTPSAFRIIVLLETVSKILERLSALPLASTARSQASYIPTSVALLLVWAASTRSLLSPTKSAYFRLLPSKFQPFSWMSKVDLTMSAQTSWLPSSPEEVSPRTWLPGSSLSSSNASADSYSKARLRFSARWLLAHLKALRFLLSCLCFI